MILAQTMTHDNSLYQQWGLTTAVLGLCVPMLGGVLWLLKLKSEHTLEAGLKIRSKLAGLLERTFHLEALRIFELIDDQLPIALSQASAENPRASAFDRLSQGLREIDAEQPNRDKYRDVLENALSRIISKEARKLLRTAEATSEKATEGGAHPTVLRFSFGHETEKILAYIAEQTTLSKKKQTAYEQATGWATKLFIVSTIVGLLHSPGVFIDTTWAYYFVVICLVVSAAAATGGMTSLLVVAVCQNWITGRAGWQVKDWLRDLS